MISLDIHDGWTEINDKMQKILELNSTSGTYGDKIGMREINIRKETSVGYENAGVRTKYLIEIDIVEW